MEAILLLGLCSVEPPPTSGCSLLASSGRLERAAGSTRSWSGIGAMTRCHVACDGGQHVAVGADEVAAALTQRQTRDGLPIRVVARAAGLPRLDAAGGSSSDAAGRIASDR